MPCRQASVKMVSQTIAMWRLWVKCSVLCAFVMVIHGGEFGRGKWDLIAINKCEEECHKFKFDLSLIKINDTHDGFRGNIVADEPFTEAIGVRIELWKYEEDQWKKFQMLFDGCMYEFFNKCSEESVKTFCVATGIEFGKLPVEKGTYKVNDCILSNKPTVGMNGTYNIKTFMIDGDKEVGCIEVLTSFKKDEE